MPLGRDRAKNPTGWALLPDDCAVVATGVIVLNHDDGDIRRAFRMVRDELVDIDQVAQEEKADVLGGFVEEPGSGPSPKTTLALALRCGVYTATAPLLPADSLGAPFARAGVPGIWRHWREASSPIRALPKMGEAMAV